MSSRKAACNPCRKAKLACDHGKPVCGRCASKKQATSCTYRTAPFRRRRKSPQAEAENIIPRLHVPEPSGNTADGVRRYPNPGYLGHSSHVTIFEELASTDHELRKQGPSVVAASPLATRSFLRDADIMQGQRLLEEVHRVISLQAWVELVETWLIRGSNLALAGPLLKVSVETSKLVLGMIDGQTNVWELSEQLFFHSSTVLRFTTESSLGNLREQICFNNARWETLGLFFTAVSMATIDIVRYSNLYTSQSQRQALRRLALRLADECLAFSLSLDCLNDIQVILQYENFINHSCANGDQSLNSWRKLGDIISSIFALGYHEGGRGDGCPDFLKHMREAVFAFTYSADKNVSIFLGRPPRMHHIYCDFDAFRTPQTHEITFDQPDQCLGEKVNGPFTYMIEAWWSLVCALQKEETLYISREKDHNERNRRASLLKIKVEGSWNMLPVKFRLIGSLMSASRSPIERDFAANARLNHLHVLFLLQLTSSSNGYELTAEMLSISSSILGLVNEQNMIKEHLISSGTGLVWRTAYYGLPAAGVLCLSLLNGSFREDISSPLFKVHQDLNVIVAQMETGALADADEPNHALLVEATATIKMVTKKMLSGFSQSSGPLVENENLAPPPNTDSWVPWPSIDSWDFEIPFWTSLAEHPTLTLPADDPP